MVFGKGKLKRKFEEKDHNFQNESSTEKGADESSFNLENVSPIEHDAGESEESDVEAELSDEGSESTVLSDELEWETSSEDSSEHEDDNKTEKIQLTMPTTQLVEKDISLGEENDEYASGDTSDEEDIRNTVGNIPMNWYDEYEHIGYDWEGKKIMKPQHGDQLDYFLKRMEDPKFWRTVRDPQTGQDVVLSDKDVELIKRIQNNQIPDKDFDEYAPMIEWFSSNVLEMPLRKFPEHKRSFVPSKDEMRQVSKYVYALKMGRMLSRRAMKHKERWNREKGPQFYMLWQSDDAAEELRRIHNHIPAPRRPLPGHAESYNPPQEYLFNEKELKKWNRERRSLGNKKLHFIPQKFNSLREVPAYKRYVRERFLRCLDLYMCPRAIKMKLTIEPEDLLPKLPNAKDLQPFPCVVSLVYSGHTDMVRSISVDPSGQFLASASDDTTVKLWEVCTGRCLRTVPVGGVARWVSWCPNPAISLLAIAVEKRLILLNPALGDYLIENKTDTVLEEPPQDDKIVPERVKTAVQWEQVVDEKEKKNGFRIVLNHFKEVRQVEWHGRGDYFASVVSNGENRSVLIHQLSRRRSQIPFSKAKGLVQATLFHPIKPHFFVATQRSIRIYDLVKQEMVKKLISSSKWISSMAVHSGGDNLLVGTYDRKVLWFDLDLSTQPYKSLNLHSQAVRSVAFHRKYPLFASTSDDGSLIVSHGKVYNDLLQNALIVPLKRFSSHSTVNDFSVLDVLFHPYQPWVFTSGADGKIFLYRN